MPCTLPPPSSSMTTNPASSSQDYERWLEQLAPHEPVSQYRLRQRHRRGQRRRSFEAPGDGPRGGGGGHRGQAGFWPLGADLLRGIRRAKAQAGAGQDHWGIKKRNDNLNIFWSRDESLKGGPAKQFSVPLILVLTVSFPSFLCFTAAVFPGELI